MFLAINSLQTVSNITDTHSLRQIEVCIDFLYIDDTGSIIFHLQNHFISISARRDRDGSPAFGLGDAVLDGVLDNWLQQHGRHHRLLDILFDLKNQDQALAETNLLYIQIKPRRLQFLRQTDFIQWRMIQ